MASSDVQILVAGAAAVPVSYQVPNAQELEPLAVAADFDGSGAAGSFLPTLVIQSDAGLVVARVPVSDAVAAGGSASVTWAPFLRGASSGGGGGGGGGGQPATTAIGLLAEAPTQLGLMSGTGNPFTAGSTTLVAQLFPFGFAKGTTLTGAVSVVTSGATPGASFEQLAICDTTGTVRAVTGNNVAALSVPGSREIVKCPFTAPYTVPTDGLALYSLQFSSNHWSTSPKFAEYTTFWPFPLGAAWRTAFGASVAQSMVSPFAAGPLVVGQVVSLDAGNAVGAGVWVGLY